MNQQEANQNIDKWGVLLLLDTPTQIELGIDNTSWIVGSKFKGIKLIPPGPHYVYYALKSENYQFKLGFFIYIQSKQRIHVRRWNEKFEDFVLLRKDEEDDFKLGVNNYDFDNYLGAYPLERVKIWQDMSNYISSVLIDRLNPTEKRMYLAEQEYNQSEIQKSQNEKIKELAKDIYGEDFYPEDEQEQEDNYEKLIQDQLNQQKQQQEMQSQENQQEEEGCQPNYNQDKTNNNQMEEEQKTLNKNIKEQRTKQSCYSKLMEDIKNDQDKQDFSTIAGQIYYTDIPKRKMLLGVKGQDLTKANFDKSQILQELLQKEMNNDYKQLLGEMQYAFTVFLLGENYESFEHWKDLFVLVTNCDEFLIINKDFYMDLIPVIYGQLQQFPKDFFIDNISSNNFMKQCLNGFVEICRSNEAELKLKNRCEKLVQLLETKFNYYFYNNNNLVQSSQDGQIIYNADPNDDDGPVVVEDVNDFIKL